MINYTKYIRRLTICANERMEELLDARAIEEAAECWNHYSGWLAGATLVAGCITDSDLRDELDAMLDEIKRDMDAAYSRTVAGLGDENA